MPNEVPARLAEMMILNMFTSSNKCANPPVPIIMGFSVLKISWLNFSVSVCSAPRCA